jgi:predicted dehydrogenase
VTGFATLEDTDSPVRVVLVGAGAMGRHWIDALLASKDVTLVGLVDLDLSLAVRVVDELKLAGVVVGTSVSAVAASSGAQAAVNVTVPGAHYAVTTEALFAGLPVLSEKPIAPTVSQGLALAAAAEASGQLLMTSQSRRYYRTLAEFRREIATLGTVGIVTTEFFRGPHFGGFRDEMEQPLLVDMAIHAFDVARYLLDANPTSVYCETFNPEWSWYRGDAAAIATFEFDGGIRYGFSGSWCSEGMQTSWNGNWRASGSNGSTTWDGETAPRTERLKASEVDGEEAEYPAGEEIAGALAEFVSALRTGDTPSGAVHSNIQSLAMVEAATRSADSGKRIAFAGLLEEAYAEALAVEKTPAIRAVLEGWGSARGGLDASVRSREN